MTGRDFSGCPQCGRAPKRSRPWQSVPLPRSRAEPPILRCATGQTTCGVTAHPIPREVRAVSSADSDTRICATVFRLSPRRNYAIKRSAISLRRKHEVVRLSRAYRRCMTWARKSNSSPLAARQVNAVAQTELDQGETYRQQSFRIFFMQAECASSRQRHRVAALGAVEHRTAEASRCHAGGAA
jgi:hypothetical protein